MTSGLGKLLAKAWGTGFGPCGETSVLIARRPKWISSPFEVLEVFKLDAYRLALAASLARPHLVFDTSLLLPYVSPDSIPFCAGSAVPLDSTSDKDWF